MKTKEEIESVIREIETFNFYNRPEMLEAKENWLGILKNAVENYDKLEDKENDQINIIFVMHYLNCSNAMFYREVGKSLGAMTEVIKKFVDKQSPENINSNAITDIGINTDADTNIDKDGNTDGNCNKPL